MDFRLVDAPALPPGCCYLCNTHQGPMVDTRADDGAARVYVCARCASNLAGLFGWISPERAGELEHMVAESTQQVDQLVERLASAEREWRENLAAEILNEKVLA